MATNFQLPKGVTEEQAREVLRAVYREKQKDFRERHPDKAQQYRTQTYINFLTKLGYQVIPPEGGES